MGVSSPRFICINVYVEPPGGATVTAAAVPGLGWGMVPDLQAESGPSAKLLAGIRAGTVQGSPVRGLSQRRGEGIEPSKPGAARPCQF